MSDYRWSLGTIVGLPVAGLLVLLLIALGLACLWGRRGATSYDRGPLLGIAISAFASVIVVVGLTAWFMWPYKAEYHQWRTESGVVAQVDSRLVGQNKSTTQRFVVTLDGDRQRSCDDTRCAQVEVGDVLTLQCKRAWQWSGTHGYDCNFVSLKRGSR